MEPEPYKATNQDWETCLEITDEGVISITYMDDPAKQEIFPATRTQAIEIAKALLGAHGIGTREEYEDIGPGTRWYWRLVSDPIPEGGEDA